MNNPENGRENFGKEGLDASVIDKRQTLRIEQSLTEARKTTSLFGHIARPGDRLIHTRTIDFILRR